MPTRMVPAALVGLDLRGFDGGLNLRDSLLGVAPNETPDCMNVTLDRRGRATKRLGYVKLNSSALAGTPKNLFRSTALTLTFVQIGTGLYKTADNFASALVSVATFTTAARCGMVDFLKKLVVVHPVDGVFDYDGATWTNRSTTAKGSCITAWQNKLWVGGNASEPPRVYYSAAGAVDFAAAGSGSVDLREKDDAIITAVGGGQGMDVVGRPGLLVFKAHSRYRIHDSSTGAYVTLDGDRGAAGALAIYTLGDVTAAISEHGIHVTDASGETTKVSGKLDPLFTADGINSSQADLICAGAYRDRIVFCLPRAGSSVNNLMLEFDPASGWVVPHSAAFSCFASYPHAEGHQLYGGAPNASYCYDVFTGGADDGAAIAARFQTAWVEPGQGILCRGRRLLVSGRGTFDLYVKHDYENDGELVGSPDLNNPTIPDWDSGTDWDSGADWGAPVSETWEEFFELGVGRAFAFMVKESSTLTSVDPALLGDGVAPTVGAFGLSALRMDYVRLGVA